MGITSFLGLTTTGSSGSTTTFLQSRLSQFSDSNSNMTLIDGWASAVSGSLSTLKVGQIINITASFQSGILYLASAALFTNYNNYQIINLNLDTAVTGATQLQINSLPAKYLKKVNSSGTIVDLANNDILANTYNLFTYNGSYWIWTDMSSSGTSGSGAPTTATYVLQSSNANLPNGLVLSAGSNVTVTTNASSIIINAALTSGSTGAPTNANYILPATNINLPNAYVLTAGSNITISTNASASTVTISASSTSSGSGTTSISYITGNVSNPPTQLELNSLIGNPINVGVNYYYINDANSYSREYLALSDGFYWWVNPLTRTFYTELNNASATNSASLVIPTYDGSGQTVHPDLYYNPNKWNGYKYWMAMNPSPAGNATYENPSIVVSQDGNTWSVPPGLTNPIDPYPNPNVNSDPNILVDTSGSMWCYYLESPVSGSNPCYVRVRGSADGINWSSEYTSASDVDSYANMESPSVIWDGTQYVMWHVDVSHTPYQLTRRTCATPNGTFSAGSACTIINRPAGKDLWHLDVVKRGQIYHSFVTCCNSGVHSIGALLYFGTSNDGITWTISGSPLLSTTSAGHWDDTWIYRSSGIPTASGYDLFYSAWSSGSQWHIGRTPVTLS